MTAILDFYRDDKTKMPSPSGYTHFDIIRNWSDEKWETVHDFIQWIFPLKEESGFNPDAPLLTDEDIVIFRSDDDLKQALFLSFHRFLSFLGLCCCYDQTTDKWVTTPVVANQSGIGDEFFTKEQVAKKQLVWMQKNHNWLRITRCLHSLRLLGLEYAAESFFNALCDLYDLNQGITPSTFMYWQEAAQGGLE